MAKSKYETHVKPRLATVTAWKRKGFTDEQIFENLHIGKDAFYRYKKKYQEFSDALKEGLDDSIANVENAHYKRAVGYDYEETKTVVVKKGKDGAEQQIRIERIKKHVVPDVTAQIHFLKNRDSEHWHDRKDVNLDGKVTEYVVSLEDDEENTNDS